jgi:ABC-type multidrug transport system fused ATPase/permease subunit
MCYLRVQRGTHEELLLLRGLYYRLYAMTYASVEVETAEM